MRLARLQLIKYAANGVLATAAHYAVLYACIEFLGVSSIGVSNFIASILGILTSFIGNKYFVFGTGLSPVRQELVLFLMLYSLIAVMHGLFLYVWSDLLLHSYNIGFVIVVSIQFALGYVASKFVVFSVAKKNAW